MKMETLLSRCRFSRRFQGYRALTECINIALEDENRLLCLTDIYKEAAEKCGVSWKRLERNLRTMLDYSWKNGGMRQLEEVSGGIFYEKPTVGDVIEVIVCYLRENLENE